MPNGELGLWILSVSGGAVAGAVLAGLVAVPSKWPWYGILGAAVTIFIAIAAVPWIALGRRWAWWLGSAIGAVVGVPASVYMTIALFGINEEHLLVEFSILIGLFGAGQALTLRRWSRALTWFIASLLAGAVFGEGLQVASSIVGSNPSTSARTIHRGRRRVRSDHGHRRAAASKARHRLSSSTQIRPKKRFLHSRISRSTSLASCV